MNDELRDLYQDVIIEHSKRPRNFHALDAADRRAEGFNPLCGDTCTVYLALDGERMKDVAFQGHGCAISTASASVMTETLKGKTRAEAEQLFHVFHDLVTGKRADDADPDELGKLAVFAGVGEFPTRVKCATLCWHTARAALDGKEDPISTE
ncbi:MAG: Fe-S cluster assembly sulfur transfer protein SufU [Candidatus Binatia bacterium]